MGMISYLCKGCNRPLISYHDWMDKVVALMPNGDKLSGDYDGYGRIGDYDLMDSHDVEYWHKACHDAMGNPGYSSASESAGCQGHFFDYPIHNVREPKNPEEVKQIWLEENHGHKLKRSNRTFVILPKEHFSPDKIERYEREYQECKEYFEEEGLQAVPNFKVWERWEDEIAGFSNLITQQPYRSDFTFQRDLEPFFDERVLNSGSEEDLRAMLQEETGRMYRAHTSFLEGSSVDEETKDRIRKTARENSDYTIEIATGPLVSLDPIVPII